MPITRATVNSTSVVHEFQNGDLEHNMFPCGTSTLG